MLFPNKLLTKLLNYAKKAYQAGEIPVSSLILKEEDMIVITNNQKEKTKDITAHAEIIALKKAAQKLGRWYLDDCTLITTLEPCPMCFYAILEARIKKVIYLTKDLKNGAINSPYKVIDKPNQKIIPEIIFYQKEEFSQLIKDFFKTLRK